MHRTLQIVMCTWMFACLLIGSNGLGPATLCIKTDGRVDLEFGRIACLPSSASIECPECDVTVCQAHADDSCGPCTDIPISLGKRDVRRVRAPTADILPRALPAPVIAAVRGCLQGLPGNLAAASAASGPPSPGVATTVLLI